jgi:Carbohydrate binding module (family 6)
MNMSGRIAASAAPCLLVASLLYAAIPAGYTGTVFTGDTLKGHPQAIPGVIKAVFFDEGGREVGFHDDRIVPFGSIRVDTAEMTVGMQPFGTGDRNADGSVPPQGSYHLGWIGAGEWVKFTVHVTTAGVYNISTYEAVASSPNTQTISFNDGAPVTISNLAPTTAPAGNEIWHNWNTFGNVATVNLDTGLVVLKLTFVTDPFNCDKLMFTLKSQTRIIQAPATENARLSSKLRIHSEKSRLAVSFDLHQAGNVFLSIIDCEGRTVSQIQEGMLSAGAYEEIVPFMKLNPGVFFVRLKQDGISEESWFVISR